jgi:hypothetical protein
MQSIYEEYYRIGYTCTDYDKAKPIIDLIDEERKRLVEQFTSLTVQQMENARKELVRLQTELYPYFKKTHAPLKPHPSPSSIGVPTKKIK